MKRRALIRTRASTRKRRIRTRKIRGGIREEFVDSRALYAKFVSDGEYRLMSNEQRQEYELHIVDPYFKFVIDVLLANASNRHIKMIGFLKYIKILKQMAYKIYKSPNFANMAQRKANETLDNIPVIENTAYLRRNAAQLRDLVAKINEKRIAGEELDLQDPVFDEFYTD
jgi:hypothetical protein